MKLNWQQLTSVAAIDACWLLSEKIALLFVKLGLSVWLARLLGKTEFGEFNYFLSFVVFSTAFYALGIGRILVREFTQQPELVNQILFSSFAVRLVFSLVVLAGATPFLFWFLEDKEHAWLILLLLISNLSYAANVFEFWFQWLGRNRILVKFRLASLICFAAAKVLFTWHYPSLWTLVLLHMLELIWLNAGCYLLFCFYQNKQSDESSQCARPFLLLSSEFFDWQVLKPILQQSVFLLLSSLAVVIYLRVDIIMLQHMVGSGAVADYAVAVQFSEIWYSVPAIVFVVLAPSLLKAHKEQQTRYYAQLQQAMNGLFVGAVVFAFALLAVGQLAIPALYGASFAHAYDVLYWHVWTGVLVALREGLSQWLVSERFAEFSLFSHLCGATANVVLNLWLIPDYGAVGAAWATLAAYFFSTFICLLFLKRTRVVAAMMLISVISPLNWLAKKLAAVYRQRGK